MAGETIGSTGEEDLEPRKVTWATGFEAEVAADCYDGEECDQIRKFWHAYAVGDKDGDQSETDLVFKCGNLPVGTKITVEYPECPDCHMFPNDCQCGFDWKTWVEEYYG